MKHSKGVHSFSSILFLHLWSYKKVWCSFLFCEKSWDDQIAANYNKNKILLECDCRTFFTHFICVWTREQSEHPILNRNGVISEFEVEKRLDIYIIIIIIHSKWKLKWIWFCSLKSVNLILHQNDDLYSRCGRVCVNGWACLRFTHSVTHEHID